MATVRAKSPSAKPTAALLRAELPHASANWKREIIDVLESNGYRRVPANEMLFKLPGGRAFTVYLTQGKIYVE